MRRCLTSLLLLILLVSAAAEAENALNLAEFDRLAEFSQEYAPEFDAKQIAESASNGSLPQTDALMDALRRRVQNALADSAHIAYALAVPAILLAALVSVAGKNGGTRNAGFAIGIALRIALLDCGKEALDAANRCIDTAVRFSDTLTPALSGLLTAMGRTDAAALISPASALVGNLSVNLFRNCAIPMCAWTLCLASVGGLSTNVRMDRLTGFLSKTVCWGVGLCVTMFTALTAVRSGISSSVDGVTVRAAKYAMDSAAPVIGSGVSDAWDTYVSGVMIAKSAVGVSGLLIFAAACVEPILKILGVLLLESATAALLELLGDAENARTIARTGSVCRMTLTMCTGSIAITTILLGAAMRAGAG